jgi:hypothetical protein
LYWNYRNKLLLISSRDECTWYVFYTTGEGVAAGFFLSFRFMKYVLLLMVMVLSSGCLMLGAPHYYNYKSTHANADSIVVISYPSRLDYQYRFTKNKWDSVLVLDPIHLVYQKMTLKENASFYPKAYYSFYKNERWNLKKMEKVNSVLVKSYQQNLADVDTLYYKMVK